MPPLWPQVIAPSLPHPDPRHSRRNLINAPVLYGGGGGMEIFTDMWVYDHAQGQWYTVGGARAPEPQVSIITSLLFGTVGFGLYFFVIVCVFIRRIARARTRMGNQAWMRGPPGAMAGGVVGNPRAAGSARRGTPAELVAALPRVVWGAYLSMDAMRPSDCCTASCSRCRPRVASRE